MTDQLSTLAETTYGPVRGTVREGVHVFKGIRYGGPTHGVGRFRPPAPPARWTEVVDATDYGPACPQIGWSSNETLSSDERALWGNPAAPEPEGEDCLVLNVWTPATGDEGKRPVMVWLHGGAYSFGSGSWPGFDGGALTQRGDVVVITINHRLGVLGHLYLAELAPQAYPDSGNVGLLDVVAALRWVHDNAASFGGDPGNVTVFGESGGGSKVSILLAMPAARGLFHRAIVQSGPAWQGLDPADATRLARELLTELDIAPDQINTLPDVPTERLLAAQDVVCQRALATGGMPGGLGFSPVVDGTTLPDPLFATVEAARAADVPLLIGATRHETQNLLLWGPPLPVDFDTLPIFLGQLVPDAPDVASLIALYQQNRPGCTAFDVLVAALSDRNMRLGSISLADAKAGAGAAPVFMYMFAWESPARDGIYRAAHGLEVPFVFRNLEAVPVAQGSDSAALADRMSDAWIEFARNGDPNHPGLPKWSPYTVDERATMVFDVECRLVADFAGDERAAWAGVDGAL